jgi:hypothetical protein
MFFAYTIFGSAWAYFCYKHVTELLPIQVRSWSNGGVSLAYYLPAVLFVEPNRVSRHRDGSKLG